MSSRTLIQQALTLASGLTLAAACTAASAQAPAVKLLVGFPAGGAPDAVARQFAEALRRAGNASVVVENRIGAAGKLAIDHLLTSPADGQTLMVMPAVALILVPMTVKSATYDVARDFVAVGNLAEYGFAIAAGPASGARTLPAFVAWAKANPGKASFATPGLGTPQHFLGAELEKVAGITMTHVPYKGGALALTDVLSGQVPLLITTEPLLVPHHDQGKLTTLLVTSPARNPKMANVPTAREGAMVSFETRDWFGLFARTGTSGERANAWRKEVGTALANAAFRKSIEDMSYSLPTVQTGLAQRLESERASWAERVRLAGFKASD